MAKPTAPLLSFGASGSLAKTAVYASWRGIPYVRRHVIPSNPNTVAQQNTRSLFKWLSDLWKTGSTVFTKAWDASAKGRPFTGRNNYTGKNVQAMISATDLQEFIASPGVGGGLPLASIAGVRSSGKVVATVTWPTPPTDWTPVSANIVLLPEQDPHSTFGGGLVEGTIAYPTAIATFNVSGSTTTQLSGYSEWMKPDATTAYGASINTRAM